MGKLSHSYGRIVHCVSVLNTYLWLTKPIIMKKSVALILLIAASVILFSCEKENPEQGLSGDNNQPAAEQGQTIENKSNSNISSLKELEGKWVKIDRAVYMFNNQVSYDYEVNDLWIYFTDSAILVQDAESASYTVMPYIYENNTLYVGTGSFNAMVFINIQKEKKAISAVYIKNNVFLLAQNARASWKQWFNVDKETSLAEFLKKMNETIFSGTIDGEYYEYRGTENYRAVEEDYLGKVLREFSNFSGDVSNWNNDNELFFYFDNNGDVVYAAKWCNYVENWYVYYDSFTLFGTIQ